MPAILAVVLSSGACDPAVDFEDGGPDPACQEYVDQQGTAVTFRITNDSGVPIYLPTSCGHLTPNIQPKAGPDGTSYDYLGYCLSTCADLQESGPLLCAADACAEMALRIEPGQSHEYTWDGTGLSAPKDMPDACWYEPPGDDTCRQIVAAPAGSYRFEVPAFNSCGPECSCEPDGQCFGQATGAQGYADPVVFAHPGDGVVDVLFGPCAFGCAEDA